MKKRLRTILAEDLAKLDEREREVLIDSMAIPLATLIVWPLLKRAYAKRGAPPWVPYAVLGVVTPLLRIEAVLRRQEKQAIRNRRAARTRL